ncbi:MAG: phosphoribosylformylglycinamidine synthase subunit PurS [Candidatus Poribacteria bacterium]
MEWKIEVGYKPNATDSYGEGIKNDIKDLGILGVQNVKTMQIYMLVGDIDESDVENICKNLLTDSITQYYEYKKTGHHKDDIGAWVIDVTYKPGVTDTVGDSTVKGIKDLGISGIKSAKTGKRFIIKGELSEDDIGTICRRLLANEVIQNYSYYKVTNN